MNYPMSQSCAAENSSGLSCLLLPAEPTAQQSCQPSAVSELGVVRPQRSRTMKSRKPIFVFGGLLAVSLAIAACSPHPEPQAPLASGQIIKVVLGDKPVMRAGEIGSWGGRPFTQGRVDVYERVVIVTEPDGTKHSAPPDWFSEVTFK